MQQTLGTTRLPLLRAWWHPALVLLGALSVTGCGLVYKSTGAVLTSYAQDVNMPYVLASRDLRLAACGTGPGLNQFIGSFQRVGAPPAAILISLDTLAGLCAAQAANLVYLRALNAGETSDARDAYIREQRAWQVAAVRRFQAYNNTVRAYGTLGDGQCPALDSEFDQAQFLIGILTSMQALLSDIRAGGSVGVPTSIAAEAARASRCLDNQHWWGVPAALRAVIWLSVPGTKPQGKNAWQTLEAAARLGAQQGMPLAASLLIRAVFAQSDLAWV